MTVKERLHQIVEAMPEGDAETLLKSLEDSQEMPAEMARRAVIQALQGSCVGAHLNLDDFLREKHEETVNEERWPVVP